MMKYFVLRLCAYGVLTLCVLGGAFTYASSVMAAQTVPPVQMTISTPSPTAVKIAYADTGEYENGYRRDIGGYRNSLQSQPNKQEFLLPVILWFFGSALLAMVGYKRMRHSDS